MPDYDARAAESQHAYATEPEPDRQTLAERSQSHADAIARMGERLSSLEMTMENVQGLLQTLAREVGL